MKTLQALAVTFLVAGAPGAAMASFAIPPSPSGNTMLSVLLAPVPPVAGLKICLIAGLLAIAVDRLRNGPARERR